MGNQRLDHLLSKEIRENSSIDRFVDSSIEVLHLKSLHTTFESRNRAIEESTNDIHCSVSLPKILLGSIAQLVRARP